MSKLYVVATPIGNLGDFSKRAIEVLETADLILAEDTRHTLKLLNYFNISTKMVSYHKFNEKQKTIEIIEKMKNEDLNVALVTDAGTPCISDPGYIIVDSAHDNGIEVLGVPGASAVITALSMSGFDTQSFAFYGFVPRENKEINEFYDKLNNSNALSLVIYESPKRIIKTLKQMNEKLGNITIAVMTELTKIHEKVFRGNISDVILELTNDENAERGEYVIVIKNEKVFNDEPKDNANNSSNMSLEGKLVDYMVTENITLKEAISKLSKEKNVSKSKVYEASLNLKEILKGGNND